MRYIEFGESKRKVSEVVLGTMRIAPLEISQVCDLIDVALDAGINAIDTAPIYGPSESILGKVFETRPDLRDKVWLQTKFGIRKHPSGTFNYFDGSYEHIIESVDESLKALKVDHIDSLLFHRPDPLMEPQGVADAFDELKKAGKVIDFGVSNQNPPTMGRLERVLTVPITANQVQLSCAFTPMIDAVVNANMENEGAVMRDGGILEYCAERDMAIQAWSVLQHGYFGGVFLGDENYAELNRTLERIGEEHGVSATAVAINWVLRYPAKMQALIGTTTPSRVQDSADATSFEMTREEWYEIYISAGNRLP